MKANELMIGNWVRIKITQHNTTVTNIDANSVYTEAVFPIRYDEIEPIPLTHEILEKNEFEVTRNMSSSGNKDIWSLRVSKNKVFHIIEHHNKRKFPYFWIELGSNSDIEYVHQLQNALRLCKIEKEIEL